MLRFVLASIVIVSAVLLSCKNEQGKKNLLLAVADSDSAIVMYYQNYAKNQKINIHKAGLN